MKLFFVGLAAAEAARRRRQLTCAQRRVIWIVEDLLLLKLMLMNVNAVVAPPVRVTIDLFKLGHAPIRTPITSFHGQKRDVVNFVPLTTADGESESIFFFISIIGHRQASAAHQRSAPLVKLRLINLVRLGPAAVLAPPLISSIARLRHQRKPHLPDLTSRVFDADRCAALCDRFIALFKQQSSVVRTPPQHVKDEQQQVAKQPQTDNHGASVVREPAQVVYTRSRAHERADTRKINVFCAIRCPITWPFEVGEIDIILI